MSPEAAARVEEPESLYEDPPNIPGPTEAAGRVYTTVCNVCGDDFGSRWKLKAHRAAAGHRGVRGRPPAEGGGTSKERAPQARKARIRLDKFGTSLAAGGSWIAARTGHIPLSRVLTLESAALGPAFEDAVKGTRADKLVQPVARLMDGGSKFGALAGLPAATEMFCRNPNPMTQAAFVGALELALPLVIASMKDARKRQEKLEQDLSELAEAFGKQPGEKVTIDEVARWIFAPEVIDATSEERPQPEGAVA